MFRTFPEEVLNLKDLRYLDISNNKLEIIPTNINALHFLETLNVSKNNITELPQELLCFADTYRIGYF